MGVCNCSMFCCSLLYVHSSIAIILMGKRELIALLSSSSWCLVMVEWLFLAVPWGCLPFVIVVFPDHTHLLFLSVNFLQTLYILDHSVISVLFLLCFHVRLFIDALWSPAGKGLTSWISFVMSNCEVVTFPLVSWVRYGA